MEKSLNYLRDNPGKLSELARLLGHDSVNTTTIYACFSEQDMAEDLERSRFNTPKRSCRQKMIQFFHALL